MDVMTASQEAERLYRESLDFIEKRGWRRIEEGDGWWWNVDRSLLGEYPLGEALQLELEHQGIDTRQSPDLPMTAAAWLDRKPGMFRDWPAAALALGYGLLSFSIVAMLVWWAL